uniref:Uncharacterized protein n=1 Tax=Arundo donax TaxID=35708 RepID=A0A0A8YBS4_ARUDO
MEVLAPELDHGGYGEVLASKLGHVDSSGGGTRLQLRCIEPARSFF